MRQLELGRGKAPGIVGEERWDLKGAGKANHPSRAERSRSKTTEKGSDERKQAHLRI